MMSRWIVPVDNTNTMFLEFRHIRETPKVSPAWWADRDVMLPAQLPDTDVYEERQRQPGDYEAQVGQRPIAIHGLEHLGTTDRGIIIFRRQLRRGIEAVREGRDPEGVCREAGKIIPTYCNDTVLHLPSASPPAEEQRLLQETGRKLAQEYIGASQA